MKTRIKLAIQKKGRLYDQSLDLLRKSGVLFENNPGNLLLSSYTFPLDLMLIRNSDIPKYVDQGLCDLGIIGENLFVEKKLSNASDAKIISKVGFGKCRLSLAAPKSEDPQSISWFRGKRIATSYPATLSNFLKQNNIKAEIVEISGSVEIAPAMKLAEGICDLVSSGQTLKSNGLVEVTEILNSEAAIIQTRLDISQSKENLIFKLCERISGVLKAKRTKYIMMNAPISAVEDIKKYIPGMTSPSVIPLAYPNKDMVAIQAVANEEVFWETIQTLKDKGASSILVLPIEKIIE